MKMDLQCLPCQVQRQMSLLQEVEGDKVGYMREVLRVMADLPEDQAAPCMVPACDELFARYFTAEDTYAGIKRRSNEYVLAQLDGIRAQVEAAEDPVLMGLRFARMGNYIDFGVLKGRVDMDEFDGLIRRASTDEVDPAEYARFREELDRADKLVYLTDNAGEIVLDRLLVEMLRRAYPDLDICVGVRGKNVVNDATREDARAVGMEAFARIEDNGSGIPGTYLPALGAALRREMETADVILSKGQGNFETLHDCGLNIYYLFLCKCRWFTELFHTAPFTGMFVNERRLDF